MTHTLESFCHMFCNDSGHSNTDHETACRRRDVTNVVEDLEFEEGNG